jgi:hypothetical protein
MKLAKNTLMLVAVVVIIYLLFTVNESYTPISDDSFAMIGGPSAGPSPVARKGGECSMRAGSGLASALLPREVAAEEDFSEFAPQDILKAQNFLSPRAQVGFPETVGGALRNANQQVRFELPNPKQPYVWNNSTIVPDLARRPLD